jgi:uncharacterized integral membrane protein
VSTAAKAKAIALSGLALLLLLFVVQNTEVVTVNFLFWSLSMSRVILIALTAAVGFACGFLVARLIGRPGRSRPTAPGAIPEA